MVTRPTVWLDCALVTRGGESFLAHLKHHIGNHLLRHLPPPLALKTRVQTFPEASLPWPISHTTLSCCCPLYWACYELSCTCTDVHTHRSTHTGAHTPYSTLKSSLYCGKFTITLPNIYEHTRCFKNDFFQCFNQAHGSFVLCM